MSLKENSTEKQKEAFERLISVLREKKIKDADFYNSLKLENPTQTWNNWKKRGLPTKEIPRLAEQLNLNHEWLSLGTGPKFKTTDRVGTGETGNMLYPVYVHVSNAEHAYSVTIPDFPGCFSVADEWQNLHRMIQEAIELWCEGQDIELPKPTPLDKLMHDPKYEGGVWMIVDVDTTRLKTKAVRLNISLPLGLVREIDDYVKAHRATRSGFLAEAARQAMRQG